MGKIVAMLNMKGGVGKTTLTVNIAGALAKLKHKRVLVIDLDPQYNATQYLVSIERHPEYVDGAEPTVFDLVGGGVKLKSILNSKELTKSSDSLGLKDVARTLYRNESSGGLLDLIPGTLHLINMELAPRGMEHRLQRFVHKIRDAYDYILVDCPPTFSFFLLSGILASDYYLVPVKPDPLSTLGVPLLETVIESYSETYEKEIHPLGVVFTMVRKTNEMKGVMDGLKKTSAGKRYIFRNYLSNSTLVAEASGRNAFLFEYPGAERYGEEIVQITNELVQLFD